MSGIAAGGREGAAGRVHGGGAEGDTRPGHTQLEAVGEATGGHRPPKQKEHCRVDPPTCGVSIWPCTPLASFGWVMRDRYRWERLPCACTEPLEGPTFPSEDRDLPSWASSQAKIAIVGQNCAKLGKSQPKLSPFRSHARRADIPTKLGSVSHTKMSLA